MEEENTLVGLPFVRWCRRFREGTVRLRGTVVEPVVYEQLTVCGPVELVFAFRGGEAPCIVELALSGELVWGGLAGSALVANDSACALDEAELEGTIRRDLLAQAVLRGLSDVTAWTEVVPDGEVVVKFQHGVQATISAEAVLTVHGRALGPPTALRLTEPLVMEVDGEGVRLSHQRFHRLASLARLRIEGATLHPDGEVRLKGGANGQLDRLVRGGLHRASARLSDLVRRSPNFARVRRFLQSSSG